MEIVKVTRRGAAPDEGFAARTTPRGAATLTVTTAVALTRLESVATAATVKFPLAGKLVVKLEPEPVDGFPWGAFQEKEYGGVPPVAEELQVTGSPAAMPVEHVAVTTRAGTLICTVPSVAVWLISRN